MRVFKEFCGTASDFRVGVSLRDVGAIKVDGVWLRVSMSAYTHGREVDASIVVNESNVEETIRKLETIAGANSEAVAGAYMSSDGQMDLQWLLSPQGNLLPPSRRDSLKQGWKILARSMPWLLIFLIVCIWSISNIMQGFGYVILLVISILPLIYFILPVYIGLALIVSTLINRSQKHAELALQQQLAKPVSEHFSEVPTARDRPGKANGDVVADRLTLEEEDAAEEPRLQRLRGRARSVRVKPARAGTMSSRVDFKCFQFSLEGENYALFASGNSGGGSVFLAEDDHVEVIVVAYDELKAGWPRLVWAMRNLEDGGVYACHRIMVADNLINPLAGTFRMTQMTPRVRRSFRNFVLLACVGAWMLINGTAIGVGGKLDLTMLAVSTFGPPMVWVIFFDLPMLVWNLKWRSGRPSKRQRLTERVYALLGIGSPLRPPSPLIDV